MSAALIVNPKSGGGNRKGVELAQMLRGTNSIVRVLTDFTSLAPVMDELGASSVTDIFVSSGDGTIQAIQTMIAENRRFACPPRLCLLPHGTTNMTAADLGFRRKRLADQAAFIENLQPRELRERPTLRVANPGDGRVRHGMFLGTGAVWQGTRFTQDTVHAKGLKGNTLGPLATLAGVAAKSLFSKSVPGDDSRIDRPHWMRVTQGGTVHADGEKLMLIASTLQKLVIGARPFWGGAVGPLRASIFPYPMPNLARWMMPMMYGGESRKAPAGAASFSGTGFEIETRTPFVIDGEYFDPPEGQALRVEAGPVFTYIVA